MPRWRLDRFGEELDSWIQREEPGGDLRLLVTAWIMSRADNPYRGAMRASGFENLWQAVVPNSDDGAGHVVACSYWIYESESSVRCNSFATLGLPL